jgi:hypothetical protein
LSVAIHPTSGDVYVAGSTASTDFPGTTGGAQASPGGASDAFIARLNAGLTTLYQATYLGGSGDESVFALALLIYPTSGDVYVAGDTLSTDFPGTAGGAQPSSNPFYNGFAARLNASLTVLTQSTYLGGNSQDLATSLAARPASGEVYVAGYTGSTNLPGASGGAQPTRGGTTPNYDAFVTRLNAALTTVNQSTYFGGGGDEIVWAPSLAISPLSGDVYVAGYTESADIPGTAGGAQPATKGNTDAFIARLTADLAAPPNALTALSPANLWIGLKNSDDVGLRVDLLAEVFVNAVRVGHGELDNVVAGGSGFSNAALRTITLALDGLPMSVNTGDALKLKLSVRRTCAPAGHASGTARLWYSGQPVDSGAKRDAGTRFDATIAGSTSNYYARNGLALSKTAGSATTFIDVYVTSAASCPGRGFAAFGIWSMPVP